MTDIAMTDERLKELAQECNKPYMDGSWRAMIYDACNEIHRLRKENESLELDARVNDMGMEIARLKRAIRKDREAMRKSMDCAAMCINCREMFRIRLEEKDA